MDSWAPFRQRPGAVVDPGGVTGELWENNRYQVVLRRREGGPFGPCVHLTIRSADGSARHDWRDFQRIKNELVGEEAEAVELYPAESRLVDTANHYHLWVFPEYRFPFGMQEREVSGPVEGVSQRSAQEGSGA
jgi:hypothetical protein